jgi:outer membrane protein assembly factor BamD (BamD/ComL family)
LFGQPHAEDVVIDKPKKYEDNELPAEKTGRKKFGPVKRFFNNTMTHYNYYFNANNKLNEVVSLAKASFRDNYDSIIPFYNFSLDATRQSKSELDSVIYKCTAGIYLHNLRNNWIDDLWMLVGKSYYYQQMFDSAAYVFQYINYAWADKEEGGYDIPIASNYNGATEFTVATKEKSNPLKHRPSRNEALLWLCRNYITTGKYPQAGTLLEIFESDQNFPKRYDPEIRELKAYLFYSQKNYDSATIYLEQSLSNAHGIREKARWEFLIGQMYQARNKTALAGEFYEKAANHTTDPILEINAALNAIKVKTGDKDYVQDKIDGLLKMARRDKYSNYRDVIYYTAAQMEVERRNYAAAEALLLKSIRYSTANIRQKSISYALLGRINYMRYQYVTAHNYYDSVVIGDLDKQADGAFIDGIRQPLTKVADNLNNIHLQDSLQALARLPEKERNNLINAAVKKLRKAKGLKEEETFINPAVAANANNTAASADLLANATQPASTSGSDWYFNNQQLKAQGVAAFRKRFGNRPNVDNWRRAAALFAIGNNNNSLSAELDTLKTDKDVDEVSFSGLAAKIPLTPAKLEASDKQIEEALLNNGLTEERYFEHYPAAIETYEELLRRFPATRYKEEALFHLSYCYKKTGDNAKAEALAATLDKEFSDGQFNKLRKANGKKDTAQTKTADAATKKYAAIYDLFLEGKFEEAKKQKLVADSLYGSSHWTSQLLFIEAIYYARERQDSIALSKLNFIVGNFGKTPLADKAARLADVLKRRKEIESYLTQLDVTRNEDAYISVRTDTSVKVAAPVRQQAPAPVVAAPVIAPRQDTLKTAQAAVVKSFVFNAADPHYVIVFLNKVAPVFAREAANSYNIFNRSAFYNRKIEAAYFGLDENYQVVALGPFANAEEALAYIDKAKPKTRDEILSFISADKYKYSIISQSNLELLKENKDIPAYNALINKALPGRL